MIDGFTIHFYLRLAFITLSTGLDDRKVSTDVHAVVEILLWIVTACTSLDTFAIVHALLDRVDGCARRPTKVWGLTHFVSRTKKCRNSHSIDSLPSQFEVHNINKHFSSMSQSQSIGWVK